MFKKFVILSMCLLFLACANIGFKVSDNASDILQQSATSSIGYMFAKNNQNYIPSMLMWYKEYNSASKLEDIQGLFQEGMANLSHMVSKDPYLQLQIQNAMRLLEINAEGPQTELDLGKYQKVVDAFMAGIAAGGSK